MAEAEELEDSKIKLHIYYLIWVKFDIRDTHINTVQHLTL
jgi:hypothetical protein